MMLDVHERIEDACQKVGREASDVTIIAVSKKQSIEKIKQAYQQGQRHFGENYLQELRHKAEQLPQDIIWHFIGEVQSKKIAHLATCAAVIHSTDRESQLIKWSKIEDQKRPKLLLQVNIAHEQTKSGVKVDEIECWCQKFQEMGIDLSGLMVFPPYAQNPEANRKYFAQAKQIQRRIQAKQDPTLPCSILSMGVSNDFDIAIEEGATHVRIGTAFFGERQ
ncbi:MAG: YggS family pyridoxal phosphate-dependent enzyme [Deltaproteobacteria bacterium]|nr:YggS family pyridoxal phosphate-dependent enzyme [Deltaproteobacteria bacterium]